MPNLSCEPEVNVHIRNRPLVRTERTVIHRPNENRLSLPVEFQHQAVPLFLNDIKLEPLQ